MAENKLGGALVRFFASQLWRVVTYISLAIYVPTVVISFLEFIGVIDGVLSRLPQGMLFFIILFLPAPRMLYTDARKKQQISSQEHR